ncbi:MAG: thermonuclease family protein [Planctomycetes bacterium]|nr:thermonuclease family protein [Planctomycetota bacterium]
MPQELRSIFLSSTILILLTPGCGSPSPSGDGRVRNIDANSKTEKPVSKSDEKKATAPLDNESGSLDKQAGSSELNIGVPTVPAPTNDLEESFPSPKQSPTHSDLDGIDHAFRFLEFREWIAKSGGYHVNAKFIQLIDDKVELLKATGQTVKVPIDKLSDDDLDYLEKCIRLNPKAKVLIGKVLNIFSADTITVEKNGKWRHVKIHGILPPRKHEPYYETTVNSLSEKVKEKYVWIEYVTTSEADDLVGVVYSQGRNIGLELVAEGHAWFDPKTSNDASLKNAELVANTRKLGFWGLASDKQPQKP